MYLKNNLMTAKERYLKAQIYFENIEKIVNEDIEKSSFKLSLTALHKKIKTIEYLKDGLLKTEGNIYASSVLLRSLIEHFLVAYYFFLKVKVDNNDSVGQDYYDDYQNSEFFKQETYSLQLEDLKNKSPRTVDMNALNEIYPELNMISQGDLQSYHQVASQFSTLKNIGKFLIIHQELEPKLKAVHHLLFDLLKRYNLLSSFVHGGPYAERSAFDLSEDDYELYQSENFNEWGYILTHLAKTYLILSLRIEFKDKYEAHFKEMFQ